MTYQLLRIMWIVNVRITGCEFAIAIRTSPCLVTDNSLTVERPVLTHAMHWRFAVQIVDTGLDKFGIQARNYLIFHEQRWLTNEGQICLITMGDEITIRMMEYINNPMVTL
jgi:hypothetical protein